jgi:hypothetical protein
MVWLMHTLAVGVSPSTSVVFGGVLFGRCSAQFPCTSNSAVFGFCFDDNTQVPLLQPSIKGDSLGASVLRGSVWQGNFPEAEKKVCHPSWRVYTCGIRVLCKSVHTGMWGCIQRIVTSSDKAWFDPRQGWRLAACLCRFFSTSSVACVCTLCIRILHPLWSIDCLFLRTSRASHVRPMCVPAHASKGACKYTGTVWRSSQGGCRYGRLHIQKDASSVGYEGASLQAKKLLAMSLQGGCRYHP